MHEYFAPRLQFFGSPRPTRGRVADSATTDREVPWRLTREPHTRIEARGRYDERHSDDPESDRDDIAFNDRPVESDDDAISLDDDVINVEDDELTVE